MASQRIVVHNGIFNLGSDTDTIIGTKSVVTPTWNRSPTGILEKILASTTVVLVTGLALASHTLVRRIRNDMW